MADLDACLFLLHADSLILVLLFRLMKLNLAKLRDPYLHQNCMATLSNMALHVTHLHPYVESL